jgi:methylmalonyl-CoA mutase N-terminal domain/subunit
LAGSYFIESLTDAVEEEAWGYIKEIDEIGGSVKAIEQRYMQREIEEAAYRYQREVERDERIIVGVNRYATDEDPDMELHTVDESISDRQTERLEELRESRDSAAVEKALADLKKAAEGADNLLYPDEGSTWKPRYSGRGLATPARSVRPIPSFCLMFRLLSGDAWLKFFGFGR